MSCAAFGIHIYAMFTQGRMRERLFYARDNVLAYVLLVLVIQTLEFLTMHKLFGPWSIIIQNLVLDVIRFLCVLLLFIGGFTLHMSVIYKPVYHAGNNMTSLHEKSTDFSIVFYELFFALFGLTARPAELHRTDDNDNPAVTYQLATCMFALYEIITIIVLVNLLIAMMSNTYTRLEERSETEWKYGRARVIRNMSRSQSVPIPVNMVTVLISL